MRGWLIYNQSDSKQNEAYINWFIEEAEQQHILLQLVLREDLTIGVFHNAKTIMLHGEPASLPDFAVVRTIEPLLSQKLEILGVAVYNPFETALICNNKARTHMHLSNSGIPMANTVFVSSRTTLPEQVPFQFPFIIKATGGRGGSQVKRITTTEEWQALHRQQLNGEIIIQSAANIQPGKDVRVFVIGSEIIAAVMRNNKHDFRANYKLGGKASWYELNANETALVQSVIDRFEIGMAGIDFLIDNDGQFIFNEIEDVVGSRTLSAVSNINLLQKYVAYIKGQMNIK
ncbi:gamma-F420-2:alpha-L-glutamate ligase [Lentibacillus persicus]|uniref:Gamma-F420-2:alpha-L-glutamate ligase n=1 Tax=Lentibacillus persicus TaxID=640948 RepID=A0A1I1TIA6_9BACI|nr:ATP-grasp domain-containing protein [Lentibacillus persicus]SFD58307.1 gamma-F420-2:alpha-L-glutamate ligase [Lentibacillus persicus]